MTLLGAEDLLHEISIQAPEQRVAWLEVEFSHQLLGQSTADGRRVVQYEKKQWASGAYVKGGVAVKMELETVVYPQLCVH